jgi:tRNA A37 methylthiotransferase MiaB
MLNKNMPTIKNIENIEGSVYFICEACLSIYADTLSWCNAYPERVVKFVDHADNIVILSCQVTDLSILNDIQKAELYHIEYPNAIIWISGCLAEREDIILPDFCGRLSQPRKNYQRIIDKDYVQFDEPYWIKKFTLYDKYELKSGNLFRYHYPLRIGKGCNFNCTYCTIKTCRGTYEEYNNDSVNELIYTYNYVDKNIVLVADSPTSEQIKYWVNIAKEHNIKISIRNIEPQITMQCADELLELADKKLLDIFHCPIQSDNVDVLKDMGRNVNATLHFINELSIALRGKGVKLATNIIIDYKDYLNNFDNIYKKFDVVSWNPYWDGNMDWARAKLRWNIYITNYDKVEESLHGKKE